MAESEGEGGSKPPSEEVPRLRPRNLPPATRSNCRRCSGLLLVSSASAKQGCGTDGIALAAARGTSVSSRPPIDPLHPHPSASLSHQLLNGETIRPIFSVDYQLTTTLQPLTDKREARGLLELPPLSFFDVVS